MSATRRFRPSAAFIAIALGACCLPRAQAQQCATSYEPGPPPGTRQGHAMAYDSARGVTVLFGGSLYDGDTQEYNAVGDTWEWNGSEWALRSEAGPPPQSSHAMAYDSIRHVTVLVGASADESASETWEWDGSVWVLRSTAGPGPRYAHAAAFDSARGVTVLFGGEFFDPGTGYTYLGDTWEWDGAAWSLRATTGPSARAGHAMAFDSLRTVTVLFGGSNDEDTWEWDGTAWALRGVGGPSPSWSSALAFDSKRGVTVLFVALSWNAPANTWEWDGGTWSLRGTNGPRPLSGAAMAYDESRSVAVMVAVQEADWSATHVGKTFEWDGAAWSDRSPSCRDWTQVAPQVPALRSGSAMVFHAVRNAAVLFGGGTYYDYADTWEWDGVSWSRDGGAGPPGRSAHAMAYDSGRGVAVLFGGSNYDAGFFEFGDTWELDGTTWSHRANSGPAPRFGHAMAYDSARGVTVLFGGVNYPDYFGDTWEWDGSSWTFRDSAGPVPRQGHDMAYDASRGVVVLFGGDDGSPTPLSDIWEWDGYTWTRRFPAGSVPQSGGMMAYDSTRGVTVLLRVYYADGDFHSETWEWDGVAWSLRTTTGPSERARAMAFDSARGVTVVYSSGVGFADVWEWDGIQWTVHSDDPAARAGQAMVYDDARGVSVLFGGYGDDYLGDTWEWDGAWAKRNDAGPSPRADHAMAYDGTRGVTLLFGGRSGRYPDDTYHNDTWQWDGSSWTLLSTTGPSPRSEHAMVFDEARNVVLLYGGFAYDSASQTPMWFGDTWEWNGSSWTLRATEGPPPRFAHGMAYDSRRNVTVLYGGISDDCPPEWWCLTYDDTWEWDGNSWTFRCTDGLSIRSDFGMAYDSDRGTTVFFGGLEMDIAINDTWEWNGAGWALQSVIGPSERVGHSMVFHEARGRMLVYGGDWWVGGPGESWEYGCRCAENAGSPFAEAYANCPGTCYPTKNRYLSFAAPATPCEADAVALRVTLANLPDANNCPGVPDFSASSGAQMWVGPQVMQGAMPTGVHRLQTTPYFDTWGAMVHVADCNVVPCATYAIEAVADRDYPAGPYSAPLMLSTTPVWGDIVGNGGAPANGVVDAIDVAAMVNRFKNLPGAAPGTWCDVHGANPTQGVNFSIDALDITLVVDAFKGFGYPFAGPSAPAPCP